MRTAVLIAAAAAALTLSACNRTDDAATEASTEAAEASGAAADTAAMSAEQSAAEAAAAANAPSGARSGSGSGQTMDPNTGSSAVSDGAMTPGAQAGDTASNNVTETQRRLNPSTPAPAH